MKSFSKISLTCFAMALAAQASTAAAAPAPPQQLANYEPARALGGVIRSTGNTQMAPLLKIWQDGFRKHHPQVQFADNLKGTASGIYGLEVRTADIALMGRRLNPFERYGTYERSWIFPVEIEVATGSADQPGKSPAHAVFVHKDNPLSGLTVRQLDGIFGAERVGGWDGLKWNPAAARASSENIRSWGQLGVRGALSGKPIHVYAPPHRGAGGISFFQDKVLKGGATFNEDLREIPDGKQMLGLVARDREAIAYGALADAPSGVKVVPLAENAAGPFIAPSRSSVADRSYPLARPVYVYFTIDDQEGDPATPLVDPKIQEFVRYILSRQGQEDVARQGYYLPLTAAAVRAQLAKLDSREWPAERPKP